MIDARACEPENGRCWTPAQVATMCRGISAILGCPDLPAAARQTLKSCRELIGARVASVTLFGDDGAFTAVGYHGATRLARALPSASTARQASLRALAGRIGRGHIENHKPRVAGLPLPGPAGVRVGNLLVAAMSIEGSTVGLIVLADKPGGFAEHDLLVTAAFGELAGVAHQRCQIADSLGRSEQGLRRTTAALEASKRTLELRVARATRQLSRANTALHRKIGAFEKVKRSLEIEHGFRNAVEDSLLTGIIVADTKSRVIHVNRAFCRMVGWSRKELVGCTPPYPFWPPEHAAERLNTLRGIQRGSLPSGTLTARYLRRNGERFDVLIMNSRLRGPRGRITGLVVSMMDITRQLQTEAALRETASQLRRLSTRLLTVEERERKRISRELHDSLGQTLSALKYRLEEAVSVCGAGPQGREMRRRLAGAARVLSGAIDEVRAIVMDLRPSVLDDLGVIAAVRWLCREYALGHKGTRVAVRIGLQEGDVPEELKTIVFRLLQEALTNVARHSGADRVAVRLAVAGGRLETSVKDNGKGFVRSLPHAGFGLLSMRERSELSGGSFAVGSRPGRGTVVRAAWPLRAPGKGLA